MVTISDFDSDCLWNGLERGSMVQILYRKLVTSHSFEGVTVHNMGKRGFLHCMQYIRAKVNWYNRNVTVSSIENVRLFSGYIMVLCIMWETGGTVRVYQTA